MARPDGHGRAAKRVWFPAALAAVTLGGLAVGGFAAFADTAAPTNTVERFQRQLDSGAVKLAYDEHGDGYLRSLLKAFNVPESSQVLVFAADSFQFSLINQKTPRALYYQDNIALGAVPGGKVIEIVTQDSKGTVAFYTLDTAKTDKPRFLKRTGECILCHGFASRWASGLMVADAATGPGGTLINMDTAKPFRLTDDRTPFEHRYGGWYVTGQTGAMKHRGNVTLDPASPLVVPPGGLNWASLSGKVDTSPYLQPGSDIVSLLTLEHQSGFVNLITQINAQYRGLNNHDLAPLLRATQEDIDTSLKDLVAYMTFTDEVPLPSPVTGSSSFAKDFAAQGPRDKLGRSLRDFALDKSLFRYPLSYMIYSEAFDSLNPKAKEIVFRRLYDVLSGKDKSKAFAGLGGARGAAAINILAATKTGLPAYWKPVEELASSQPAAR